MPDLAGSPVGGEDVGASSESGEVCRVMALAQRRGSQRGSGADPDQVFAPGLKCLSPVTPLTPNMKATNERWVLLNKDTFQQIFNAALHEMTKTAVDGCQEEPVSPTEAAPAQAALLPSLKPILDRPHSDTALTERRQMKKLIGTTGGDQIKKAQPLESGALSDITNEPVVPGSPRHPLDAQGVNKAPQHPLRQSEPLDLSYKRSDDDVSSSEGSARSPSPGGVSSSSGVPSPGSTSSGRTSPGRCVRIDPVSPSRGSPPAPGRRADNWAAFSKSAVASLVDQVMKPRDQEDGEDSMDTDEVSVCSSRPSSRTSDTSDRDTESPARPHRGALASLSGTPSVSPPPDSRVASPSQSAPKKQPWVAFNKKGIIDIVDSAMRDPVHSARGHRPAESSRSVGQTGHHVSNNLINHELRVIQHSPVHSGGPCAPHGHSSPSLNTGDVNCNVGKALKRPQGQECVEAGGGKRRRSGQYTPLNSPCPSPGPHLRTALATGGLKPGSEGRAQSPSQEALKAHMEEGKKRRSPTLLQVERFVRDRVGRAAKPPVHRTTTPRSQPAVNRPAAPGDISLGSPKALSHRPYSEAEVCESRRPSSAPAPAGPTPMSSREARASPKLGWIAVSKAEVHTIIDSVVGSMMAEEDGTSSSFCCRADDHHCQTVPSALESSPPPPDGAKTAADDINSNSSNSSSSSTPANVHHPSDAGSFSAASPPTSSSTSSSSSSSFKESSTSVEEEERTSGGEDNIRDDVKTDKTLSGLCATSDSAAKSPDANLKKAFNWKKSLLERVNEQEEASTPGRGEGSPPHRAGSPRQGLKHARKSGQNSRKLPLPVRSK